MPGPIVTLLTDFGLADSYVAAMKGVMLGINPDLVLVDLSHEVPPQDVLQGAFLLGTGWSYFPSGTIHVAVVDPGVGTERNALLLRGHGHFFLAPDNGLLSFILPQEETETERSFQPHQTQTPPGFEAFALNNPLYWRHPVSATFHGRDVFAPVAAHLSMGVGASELGESVATLNRLAIPAPRWQDDRLLGHVLHIDRFGNVITSVPLESLPGNGGHVEVEIGGATVRGVGSNYASGEGLAVLVGSHGYLEIALTNGSAAQLLRVSVGDEVKVRRS